MGSTLWEVLMVCSQGKHLENVAAILKQRERASFSGMLSVIHNWIYLSWFDGGLGAEGPHVRQKEDT